MTRRALHALPEPVAWVFTAGGARSAAQVGMAEVLAEQGFAPDLLIGSSFGAVNAAALADRGASSEALRQTWRQIGRESLFASLGSAAVRGFAPRRTGRSARELREIVATCLPPDGTEIPPGLLIVASDLAAGVPVVLDSGSLLDAVMAACSMPVLLAPVQRNGTLLIDGGLTAAAPLEQALAAGARSIVLLDSGASAVAEESLAAMRWWQVAALAYSHQIRSQLTHALQRVSATVPVVVISSDAGSPLDFTDPDDQFQSGRAAAATALAKYLRTHPPRAPGIYGTPLDSSD